jgi:small subunit ribosomal protein S4
MKIGPKYKIARRLGADVFDKTQTEKFNISEARKSRNTRSKRPKTVTDYGRQMKQKQKVRFTYHISEKQFANYIKSSLSKKGGVPADKLFQELETRLDNIVYRLGLAASRGMARQMVSHGHIDINGSRITIPSFKVGLGDKISIRDRSKDKALFKDISKALETAQAPSWLKFDKEKREAVMNEMPSKPSDNLLDLHSVIEFYSR